ncbi:MAG: hypothetical protein KF845_13535 [Cyclobacteriaceae bacterium]|nr:hypothetical protein [Cyclobacteriaceae bacterium]
MKMRLTYKELSLLLGIVVAVIVLMVIWLSPVSAGISDAENSIDPFPKLQAVKAIVQKAHAIVQVFL